MRPFGDAILIGLLGVPIRLLDALTDSAFAPRSEGFPQHTFTNYAVTT